jgi:hypothetical protein
MPKSIAAAALLIVLLVAAANSDVASANYSVTQNVRAISPTGVTVQGSYESSYRARRAQYIRLGVSSPTRLNLGCMQGYLDFQFQLRSSQGAALLPHAATLQNPPIDSTSVVEIAPRRDPGQPCQWYKFSRGFVVGISKLFPDLAPGDYTLSVTFAPRDGEVPSTALPPMRFVITP